MAEAKPGSSGERKLLVTADVVDYMLQTDDELSDIEDEDFSDSD